MSRADDETGLDHDAAQRPSQFSAPDDDEASQFLLAGAGRLRVGDALMARRQRWRVARISPFERCAIVTLAGTGPNNFGCERLLLAPFERLTPIQQSPRLRVVGPVRWRRGCRAIVASTGSADAIQTAASARIDLLPHQLSPAIAIVRGLASRVLIADEVGLGKTIEASLIVAELLARQAARKVLVVAPAGLREQWAGELDNRFHLTAAVVDMHAARRRRALGAVGANPWTSMPLVITSLDYVKRPEVLAAASRERWDLVVIDEAHHVAPGTDRYTAMAALCGRAAYVVLLTATPHSGDESAFDALCALGSHKDALMVFRRTRADVGPPRSRRVHRLRVRVTPEQRRMHVRLGQFVDAVLRDHSGPDAALAVAVLRKRAASSPFALEQTVRRRLSSLDSTETGRSQMALPFDDPSGELDPADEAPAWTVPALIDMHRERRLLMEVADAARRASATDAKLAAVARLLRRLREPAIVFTEYRDTLVYLRERIAPHAAIVHGGMPWSERRQALEAHARGSVLLTTDAAGEGLNLQRASRVVINFELPWNPVRLEQRLGRVDRIGQTRTVHAFHLLSSGAEDSAALERLQQRVRRAQRAVGSIDPLGGPTSNAGMVPNSGQASADPCRDAAADEHRRVSLARVMGTAPNDLPSPSVLTTRTRRTPTRESLGGRSLVVLRTTVTDATGRAIAVRLTSLLVRLSADWRTLERLRAIAAAVDEVSLDTWLHAAVAIHQTFWARRLAREQAMAAMLTTCEGPQQIGLFDRRALNDLALDRLAQHDIERECQRRIAAASDAAVVTVERRVPVLVLHP